MKMINEFFQLAQERYRVYLARKAGKPWPWTQDSILRKYRFCNVFREDDRTTVWFRQNVREPLRDDPKVMLATIVFRWFNRISTGEILKPMLLKGEWDEKWVKQKLKGVSPIFTAAYMIRSQVGYDKLTGVCLYINRIAPAIDRLTRSVVPGRTTLEGLWGEIMRFDGLGHFMAYEVVTDLRHTYLLQDAPDILTWASPGPGCARGLSRVMYGTPDDLHFQREQQRVKMIEYMREILEMARDSDQCWPREWPQWEMREVEHTLCEFDKYFRVVEGGTMKQLYHRGAK